MRKESNEEILIRISAAWETFQQGYLSFSEFKKIMSKYDTHIETLAAKELGENK